MRLRPPRLFSAFVRHVCRAALRAAVTGLIFLICLTAASAYLGVPLPGLDEVLERFEGVSQLARILS